MEIPVAKKDSFKIFDDIAGQYDRINSLLSFGIHSSWRRKLAAELPKRPAGTAAQDSTGGAAEAGINALDLATGTGDVAFTLLAEPGVRHVTGLDLSKGMLALASQKAEQKQLAAKTTFLHGDACALPFAEDAFDAVTMSFGIRNVPDVRQCLAEMLRTLKPGGKALILEFSLPENPVIRAGHLFYLRNILPAIGNLLSGHDFAYSYLNKTIETFPYRHDFVQLMTDQGFEQAQYRDLTFGIVNLYSGIKP